MNGPPFGWSVVSEHAPRVVDQQEDLQADRPLQRVDEALVAIRTAPRRSPRRTRCRSRPTSCGSAERVLTNWRIDVARGGARLPEHDLADVDRDVRLALTASAIGARPTKTSRRLRCRSCGTGCASDGSAGLRRVDRRERRFDVAGHAEVARVDVQRMRHAQFVQRARERHDMSRGVTP